MLIELVWHRCSIPCRQMVSTKSTKNVPYHMFLLGGLGWADPFGWFCMSVA